LKKLILLLDGKGVLNMLTVAALCFVVNARIDRCTEDTGRGGRWVHPAVEGCDCSWTGNGCGQDDGSVCWHQCCGSGCDCSWTKNGCGQDDGSNCWNVCCGDSPSPGPTPKPVTPSPIPAGWQALEIKVKDKSTMLRTAGARNATLNKAQVMNSFSGTGGLGYMSVNKLNLLGGGIKATVDLSKVQNLVNANMYLVIPGTLETNNNGFYCDNSDGFVAKDHACIELDLFEANGHTCVGATMHTKIGHNSGCDTWGCRQMFYFGNEIDGNQPFDIIASFAMDGNIFIQFTQNGRTATVFSGAPGWDAAAKAAVVDGMANHGAVLVMTQWTGWVPPNTSGKGNLDGSTYSVSNIMFRGTTKGPSD